MSIRRRDFLAVVPAGLTAAVGASALADPAAGESLHTEAGSAAAYSFLHPAEALFVEALAEHMVPADDLSPGAAQIGIPAYIDRALGSGWGLGDRLYKEGPFEPGSPNQGYQLPLAPNELFRAGSAAFNEWCTVISGGPFHTLTAEQKEQALTQLHEGITWQNPLPSAPYFVLLYDLVMEGLFADPQYGGNRNKAGWKLVGFTGVSQANSQKIVQYRNRADDAAPLGIADLTGGMR